MNLRYTPEARVDLLATKQYISVELCNPSAADRVVTYILKCCSNLKEQPCMGAELAAKTGRDTDLRYLVCGKHLTFYRIEGNYVSVVRILDGRTNYMRVLFGSESL